MGYIKHHAIVVVGWEARVDDAHAKAIECGNTASAIVDAPMNGYRSFLVAPDGSKEGWGHSDQGDAARDAFVAWLSDMAGGYVTWAEVVIGDDDATAFVERHAWDEPEGVQD